MLVPVALPDGRFTLMAKLGKQSISSYFSYTLHQSCSTKNDNDCSSGKTHESPNYNDYTHGLILTAILL